MFDLDVFRVLFHLMSGERGSVSLVRFYVAGTTGGEEPDIYISYNTIFNPIYR